MSKAAKYTASSFSYRWQHISVKASFWVGLAVVAGFSLRRRDFRRLGALGLVVRVGRRRVMVLRVVVMGVGFLLVAGLLVLSLFLLLVLLLLFQPLFPLADAHELDPPLLSAQNHWRQKGAWKERKKERKKDRGNNRWSGGNERMTMTEKHSLTEKQTCLVKSREKAKGILNQMGLFFNVLISFKMLMKYL